MIHGENVGGYYPVNELEITWTIGNRYPVQIDVKSYKAKVVKTESGTLNVMRSDKQEDCSNSFKLSAAAWFECLHNMETHMRRFEDMLAAKQFQLADDLDRQNRMEAKQKQQQTPVQQAQPMYQQPQYQQPVVQQPIHGYQQPMAQVQQYAPVQQQPMYQQVQTPANFQDIPVDNYYPTNIPMGDFGDF